MDGKAVSKTSKMMPFYVALFALVIVVAYFTVGGRVQASGEFNAGRDGVAIKGYDTVAYFTDKKAVPGSGDFAHRWKGVEWRFANAENLAKFKSAPERFAPQFGGY